MFVPGTSSSSKLSFVLFTMLNMMGKLIFFLLGTAASANLQFSSPRCDQLFSSKLSFVVEWWRIDPYINNSTDDSNKLPQPTKGLV